MCFSQRTSLVSYSIGLLSAFVALAGGQYVLGMLILFFVQIQLSEFIIWRGIDQGDLGMNRVGTLLNKYTLPSHNIGIGLGILLSLWMVGVVPELKDYIPLVIGILFYLWVVLCVYKKGDPDTTLPADGCTDDTERCQNSENRLVWKYPHHWYLYGFIISLIFLYMYGTPGTQMYLFAFFIGTFLGSSYFFTGFTVGSMWCFASAVLSPLAVLSALAAAKRE